MKLDSRSLSLNALPKFDALPKDMGIRELAHGLGINPGLVSKLVKRGMPTSSADAANAWRAIHAPPRQRRDKPAPAFNSIPPRPQCNTPPPALEGEDFPWMDFDGSALADIDIDLDALPPPPPLNEPPPGMFALGKNHFLHQFHAAKARDKARRRGVKAFIRPENACDIVPYLPETGDTTHCVVRGDFILGEIIPTIIGHRPAEAVVCATLGMSEANARMLSSLRAEGLIGDLRVIVSHYFASVDATSTFARVCEILGTPPTVTRNHAKVILISRPPDYYVVAGSANLRSSDNIEQFAMWNDREVYDFHLGWMAEILGD